MYRVGGRRVAEVEVEIADLILTCSTEEQYISAEGSYMWPSAIGSSICTCSELDPNSIDLLPGTWSAVWRINCPIPRC